MSKWRKINLSGGNSPDWVVLENVNNRKQLRFLETVTGKRKRYEAELKSGCTEFSVALSEKYCGRVLTDEEKAYRRGWLAAYREQGRIHREKR